MSPVLVVEMRRTAGPAAAPAPDGPWARQRRINDPTLGGNFNFPAQANRRIYPTTKGNRGSTQQAIFAALLHDTGDAPQRPENHSRNSVSRTP
jgi:hypothetical protein